MKPKNNISSSFSTVDEYIEAATPHTKKYLKQLRKIIKQTAPQSEEVISYQMPTYKQNGILIHFGGFTKHVSLFPGVEAIEFFKDKLIEYKTSKGTIQFSIDKPLPTRLIEEIVKFKINKNSERKK